MNYNSLVVLLLTLAFAMVYWAIKRGRAQEREDGELSPLAFGMTQFKEPGSERWMSLLKEEWYALSDSGGTSYAGAGPWRTSSEGLRALRNDPVFLKEYGLEPEDVEVPTWFPAQHSWDGAWGCCNILSSEHLYAFWLHDSPDQLEYR